MTWGVPDYVQSAIRPAAAPAPTFTPWAAPGPNSQVAAGSYDPALLAALNNAQTSLTRLVGSDPTHPTAGGDTAVQLSRLAAQLGLDQADIARITGQQVQDAQTSAARGREDHTSALADLSRNYKILQGRQLQGGNAAGVLRGGFLAQSAAKRAENQAHDQQPIDTAFNRGQEDSQTAIGRAQANAAAQNQRLTVGYQNNTSDLTTQAGRAVQDFSTFSRDTQTSIGYQAQQNGFTPPPARPSNEFTNPQGQTYQIRIEGNNAVAYTPSGQVLWSRPRS